MKLDWKKISKCEGYRSLKAAYVRDVQESHHRVRRRGRSDRKKSEFRDYFKKAIGITLRNSESTTESVIETLNKLESARDYWWLNFYQDHNVKNVIKRSL